ncbi:MAG: vWA domain-containing protein [Gemmataceae bacterium]
MANEPRKPSWKNPTGAGKNPAPARKRDWQASAATPKKPTRSRRGRLIITAVIGAVLIAALVIYLKMLSPPRYPLMVAAGPPNAATFSAPENVAGLRAVKDLEEWAGKGGDRPRLAGPPITETKEGELNLGLSDVKEEGVVVYLSAPGGADRDGAFLWMTPPDAAAPSVKQKVRIKSILDDLAKLPSTKHKLLVFDATQNGPDWARGELRNDFARGLRRLESDIEKIENLVVVCASDEDDERSWVAEEWGQSVFAHFWLRGLSGGLAGDRLTAADVFKYAQGEVSAWAQVNRDATQKPFLLPGGSGPQRAKEILLASVKEVRPEGKAADYSPHAELQKAWEFRESLETQLPPEFIAPEVWRRYLDGLLRAEVMHRQGYDIDDFLQKKVRNLEASLAGNSWSVQESLGAALPMPDALGIQRAQRLTDAQFDELWLGTIDWKRLLETADATPTAAVKPAVGITLLRLEVAARMLDALDSRYEPDRGNITRAAEVLESAFGTTPVPTEVQLLQLLNKKELRSDETAKRAGPEFVRAALRTRRKAEVVAVAAGFAPPAATDSTRQSLYPAGEFVFPWIATDLSRADRTRVEGEDLLFSSRPDDWPHARRKFQEADEAYRKIGERAEALRKAYRTRNQVLAELPYYARWVAGLRTPFTRSEVTKMLADVEVIARATHELAALLDDGDSNTLGKIEDARKLAADGFQTLTNTFFKFATTTDFTATNQSNWHAIDNLLQVPFVPADVRARRLKELRAISTALLVKPRSAETKSGEGKASVSVQELAQRQGRMALAMLGSRWVEDKQLRNSPDRGAAPHSYEKLKGMIAEPGTSWWEQLQYEAGEQIGWHWRRLREDLDRLTAEARTQDLVDAGNLLRRGDSLARSLDSTTALAPGSRPAGAYRELRLHYFLLGQATRALDAGWASAADPQPYAEKVGTWFVQDAENLLLPADADQIERKRLLAAATPVRLRLTQAAKFSVRPTEPTRLVTESIRTSADFVLTPPPGHVVGIPVWRGQASSPLRLAVTADADFKTVPEFAGPKPPADVRRELAADILVKSGDSNAGGRLALELVYRGHLITGQTDVAVNSKHSAMWVYNPPEGKAAFAVVAKSDVRPGTVMIILDTSTSMILDDFGKPINKFKNALDALEAVLKELPPQTNVGLARFSGRTDPAIELVRDVAVHDFQNKPENLRNLIDKLRKDSCNSQVTPLARAIKQVMEGPYLKQSTGFKTLLVLTDGEDNYDGRNAFKVVQDAMGTEDVTLQMVLFDAGKEEKAAIDQFEHIRDLPTPGRLWHTADKDTLVGYLRNAMQPHIRVYRKNNQTLEPSIHKNGGRGVRVPAPGDNLEGWSPALEPSLYYLRAFGESPSRVELEPGDRLYLELRTQNGLLKMVPYRYTQEIAKRAPTRVEPQQQPGRDGIRLAVPQCILKDRRDSKMELELTVMMDRYHDDIDIARMDRPGFAWFEVRTRDQKLDEPPQTVNIINLDRYPAPTWKLQVPVWPASKGEVNVEQYAAVPVISAWWLDTFPAPAGRLPRDVKVPLVQDAGPQKLHHRTIGVEGDEVTIENVRIENHTLIVQAQHPKNRPIFIRANGLVDRPEFDLKQAHFFYDEVGRYTAKFGPVETLTEKTPFVLEVHSLKRLKDEIRSLPLDLNMVPKQNDTTGFTVKPVDLK